MGDFEDEDALLDDEEIEDDAGHTYLTFDVGPESYAVPVGVVSEILALTKIAAVPDAPAHLPGVINLRGRVVPVMSMRARFGLSGDAARPVVIVVQGIGASAGLIVDGVRSVLKLPAETIRRPAGAGGEGGRPMLVQGVAVHGEATHLLIDAERLLGETSGPA